MAGDYLLDYGLIFAVFVLIDDIGPVDSRNGLVRGYLDDIELINGGKLLRLGYGGTGHAGEFVVKSEVILEGDGRKSFILALNIDMLLCLYRLMQTLAVTASEHDTTRKLVNDEYLAVFYDIVYIALHDAVRLERLIDMMGEGRVFDIRVVFKAKDALCLFDASCGERSGPRFFIYYVVGIDILVFLVLGVGAGIDLLPEP